MAKLRPSVALVLTFVACGQSEGPTPKDPAVESVPLYAELCRFVERCEPQLLEMFTGGTVEACLEGLSATAFA